MTTQAGRPSTAPGRLRWPAALAILAGLAVSALAPAAPTANPKTEPAMPQSVYDFSAARLDGKEQSLGDYRGKVLLIVNTASKCGFTPQYEGLEKLYREYEGRGFAVLGFPCNQFGGQEPGSSEDIAAFCRLNYGVTFPMFSRIEVNGDSAHPLYKYLKSERPGVLSSEAIKWNFTKFLIDAKGQPVKRYSPQTKPEEIRADLEKLLPPKP